MLTKWIVPTDAGLILPSDSSKRKDLLFLAESKWDDAEQAKHELEELQRHDKKQRDLAS